MTTFSDVSLKLENPGEGFLLVNLEANQLFSHIFLKQNGLHQKHSLALMVKSVATH